MANKKTNKDKYHAANKASAEATKAFAAAKKTGFESSAFKKTPDIAACVFGSIEFVETMIAVRVAIERLVIAMRERRLLELCNTPCYLYKA